MADCELEAEVHGSRLCYRVAQPVELEGEPELLRRAVENVVRNAVRHAPEGTAVDVSLSAESETATIVVRDRGDGVPEEALREIFKPF